MKPGEKIPPHTLARVTNRKMQTERDFEKGEAEGSSGAGGAGANRQGVAGGWQVLSD